MKVSGETPQVPRASQDLPALTLPRWHGSVSSLSRSVWKVTSQASGSPQGRALRRLPQKWGVHEALVHGP